MADSVGSYRPRPIITTRRPKRAVTYSQVVHELADSVGGNRPRSIITTRRYIRAVTCIQVVGESVSQSGMEKSSLADKFTEQAPLTSSGQLNTRHQHLHLVVLLRLPLLHLVLHLL